MELRSLTTPVDFPVESDVICDDDNEDDKDDDDVRSDDAFSTEPEFANVERSLVRMISIGSSPTEARLALCSFRPFDTRERGGRTYARTDWFLGFVSCSLQNSPDEFGSFAGFRSL